MISDYQIIHADSSSSEDARTRLQRAVQLMLEQGYAPQGNLLHTATLEDYGNGPTVCHYYSQVVVKHFNPANTGRM